jgi:diacylglycerol kinase family enzyme
MKRFVGDRAAFKLSTLRTIAENTDYFARLEVPEGEVSEEFRQLILKPRAYHCVRAQIGQHMFIGEDLFDCVPSAKVDDGRFEIVLSKAKSRRAIIKNLGRARQTGALEVKEAADTETCFASVTSLTVLGGTEAIAVVDEDFAQGSSFRITVAPTKLNMFC